NQLVRPRWNASQYEFPVGIGPALQNLVRIDLDNIWRQHDIAAPYRLVLKVENRAFDVASVGTYDQFELAGFVSPDQVIRWPCPLSQPGKRLSLRPRPVPGRYSFRLGPENWFAACRSPALGPKAQKSHLGRLER